MYCKNCGNEIRPDQKVCTECGEKLLTDEQNGNEKLASEPSNHTERSDGSINTDYQRGNGMKREPMTPKKKRRLAIILGSVAALLLVLFVTYQVLSNMYSHEHVLNEYTDAVTSGDAEGLQGAVSTDISIEEAESYIRYIDASMGFSQLQQSVNQVSSDLDNGFGPSGVYDEDFTLLDMTQDGKKFGLFEEYSLTIPKHNVLLELPEDVEALQYEFNGETTEVDTGNTKLNELIPGKYALSATSTINEETFDSTINVDFSNYYGYETVFAELDLGLYYVSLDVPILYSFYDIDSEDITVKLNGESQTGVDVSDSENDELGPFKYGEEYEIGATLEYEGKAFDASTEKLNISNSETLDSENHHMVSLDFDEEALSEHSDDVYEQEFIEQERESFEENIEYEVENFIASYFSDLERAYDNRDIVYIEDYIIEGTETYNALNSNFENDLFPNLTIWGLEVVKFERDGENIYIEVYSDRLHDDLDETVEEKTAYNILYDEENLTFKIESFLSL
ncbi:TcaA NTF2-like domain-containing protein [Salinicoccus luteus]|uniref:TcaA NTF2-like domain-containing protein n=1 Tax=Salinicoccus luteus TaxID=367840 RepID=UPI0004E1B462|nr:zinc-ribbon domain-containing protein [Salinicoccus luteus]